MVALLPEQEGLVLAAVAPFSGARVAAPAVLVTLVFFGGRSRVLGAVAGGALLDLAMQAGFRRSRWRHLPISWWIRTV